MIEGLWASILCSVVSICLGILVWMFLRDKQKRQGKKEEAKRRFLEETRRTTQDPEILEGLEKLARKEPKE